MSDIETLNRAFAQAVATGTSTVLVGMPNSAGKSTLHRQIEQTKRMSKTDNPWFEPIESRYEISIDEAETLKGIFDRRMMNSIKSQDWRGLPKGDA